MKFLALTVFMLSISSAHARQAKMPPIYPSVSLKTDVVELEADECVKRIMPADMTNFSYKTAKAYSADTVPGEGSLASFMEKTFSLLKDNQYIRDILMEKSVAEKTAGINVLVEKTDKTSRKLKGTATARINPVYNANADVTALSLGYILPFADDIDYALLGIPNAINSALNNALTTWNNNKEAIRRSKQTRANITVANVTEARIQAALDLMVTAQALNLLQYSCDKNEVQKQVRELTLYLNKASNALNTVLK